MINILIKNEYEYHISILLRLLSINGINIVKNNNNNNLDNLIKTYTKIKCNIYNKIKHDIVQTSLLKFLSDYSYFNHAYKNCETLSFSPISIEDVEDTIYPIISKIIGVKLDVINNDFIKWSIKYFYNRIPNQDEINYHIENNKDIDIITWLFMLYFSDESKKIGLFDTFNHRLTYNKKIAIIFTGHTRNLEKIYKSHIGLVFHPNINIFIHTWDDKGLKTKNFNDNSPWIPENQEQISIDHIKDLYHPIDISMENNKNILKQMSYTRKISPIFLYECQAKDDASKYINSQLYSIYKAYLLLEKYQNDLGFEYDVVIKLRFDFDIHKIDLFEILKQMSEPRNCPAVYFAHPLYNYHCHPGGGGGCLICDTENDIKLHKKHNNDICDIWFYTDKYSIKRVCELFLNTLDIMKKNHQKNLELCYNMEVQFFVEKEFVYIVGHDIEKEIVCFYPERMLREHLEDYHCKNSMHIVGKVYSDTEQ
jgi:hypothetical protein